MSRHGRPHQPHLGGDPDAPRPEAAGQEAHDAARAEDPRGSEDGAPGGGAPREDVPAEHAPAAPTPQAPAEAGPRAARIRVNDGAKVTPLAEDEALQEVPDAGGRFSAWRRTRQDRAAARTLTASRRADDLPPAAVPGPPAGPGVRTPGPGGSTVVAFPGPSASRRRRRRLAGVLAVLVLIAVLAGVLFLTPLLAVREVQVRGAELTDPARVEEALAGYHGVPLPRVSEDEVRDAVGAVPQVRSIEVVLEPPHRLVVELQERVPVAAVADGGEFSVVDSEGVELRTAATAQEAGVPVVEGGPEVLGTERFEAIAGVLAALPESVLGQLSAASAESLSSVELDFADGRTVVWGTAEDSELKAQVLRELVEARGTASGVETYDVSSPTRPVVR
ncbi:FtsQ-type POTRA domain-containing protein [Kocuria flava]|uniref:cell division protein FtsQ/DivIB n=1 Tax=Kocuria flava TaxID=446860 RepID=UPI001FF2A5EC|nr:FtsQ-type POTRA domain-containing protein [Kocuria flava]MCJ8505815.1 FtsQ-type POTRA domain-containing protein [Kocuria flava]